MRVAVPVWGEEGHGQSYRHGKISHGTGSFPPNKTTVNPIKTLTPAPVLSPKTGPQTPQTPQNYPRVLRQAVRIWPSCQNFEHFEGALTSLRTSFLAVFSSNLRCTALRSGDGTICGFKSSNTKGSGPISGGRVGSESYSGSGEIHF